MKPTTFLVPIVLLPLPGLAQLARGGAPVGWGQALDESHPVALVSLPPLEDPEAVLQEASAGFRYGTQRFVEADVVSDAAWTELPDGRRVGRLSLRSPGAVMLSVQFSEWEIPPGGMVYLYDAARTRFIGGFDADNRGPDGTMATAVLPGDEVTIEYILPGLVRAGQLRVASITHGLVDLFRFRAEGADRDIWPGYDSAPCHVNINCPLGAAWQQQKRAVAMYLRPDGNGCTGALVNNTTTPGRPFFLTAWHCYQPNTSQWVFYFNYESPGCVGTTGPSNQSLTGSTLRAGNYWTDLCLVELNSNVPAAYNPFFAGWDRSGATPQNSVVIEHPLFDVKKIAVNNDPSTTITDAIGVQCWRGTWEQGIVEPVASGAPLFDQNKRVVGHLYAGTQTCTNAATVPTDCAKLSGYWNGNSASQRLRDWLDPSNTVQQLNGYDPAAASPVVRVRLKALLEGPYSSAAGTMDDGLRSGGHLPTTEPYTASGYTHVGGGGETAAASVFTVTGNNAIVDWVVVELRNKNNPAQVLATRSALVQRDGDIVATNGTGDVELSAAPDQYYIAVRHRNHLGIMTASAIALSATASGTIDLSDGSTALYGGTEATKASGTRRLMWAGDVLRDGLLRYTGPGNDRDPILLRIGGVVPTNTVTGYHPEDTNLDGTVRYVGSPNDRDRILENIGGTVPTATRQASLP